jgi:ribosome recycling factor
LIFLKITELSGEKVVSKEKKVKELVTEGRYEFSRHAEREREADKILVRELEDALTNCETIEDYPDDPRGASFLTLGFSAGRPIHAVCSIRTNPEELLLITVYDPSRHPYEWIDNYRK